LDVFGKKVDFDLFVHHLEDFPIARFKGKTEGLASGFFHLFSHRQSPFIGKPGFPKRSVRTAAIQSNFKPEASIASTIRSTWTMEAKLKSSQKLT
jgi:hypothetical protein